MYICIYRHLYTSTCLCTCACIYNSFCMNVLFVWCRCIHVDLVKNTIKTCLIKYCHYVWHYLALAKRESPPYTIGKAPQDVPFVPWLLELIVTSKHTPMYSNCTKNIPNDVSHMYHKCTTMYQKYTTHVPQMYEHCTKLCSNYIYIYTYVYICFETNICYVH